MFEQKENTDASRDIEVVEIFDDQGQSMVFEILETIEDGGKNYFLLTSYHEENQESNDEVAEDVFIMQEVEIDGEKMLAHLEEREVMEKIFAKFREKHKDNFNFE